MRVTERYYNSFHSYPRVLLLSTFLLWKALLLTIVSSSPGSYDSSTELLFKDDPGAPLIVRKLVKWDAIYFIRLAERGYVYEQEWAFGWGFTRTLALTGKGRRHLHRSLFRMFVE